MPIGRPGASEAELRSLGMDGHGNMAIDCEGRELTDERIANAVRTLAQWLEREPDGSVLITRGDEMGRGVSI